MILDGNSLGHTVKFHFEYSLESQKNELEGKEYTGYGVSAKMIDENGEEAVNAIQNITLDPKTAQDLLQLLGSLKISSIYLKSFVTDFLNR